MRLLMVMYGVEHLEASVDYYHELGLVPAWWPDEESVVLSTDPASPTLVMLSRDSNETMLGPGGVFAVDDLDEFFRSHDALDWLVEPVDGSIGRYAAFADRTGVAVRLVDYRDVPAAAELFEAGHGVRA
jgi:catechol 2,3-dioxygenase-like lactoylglutathione lyase family enzyme